MAVSKETAAQLQAILATLGDSAAPVGGGWGAPAPAPMGTLPFIGVSIPINLQTPIGRVKVHLALPPEVAASPTALMEAIKRMVDMGLPVDAYTPKENGGGWGGRREYGNGGGYNGGNGGGRNFGRSW
jgi:hypothetical protein